MNDGRYGERSVLTPRGMAMRHAAPSGDAYGLGWEFVQVGGRTLINHDGGSANFQSSLFIDPAARVGVYVAANAINVINALDAFASPHGLSPLNGLTTRVMAQTVLSIVTNRPLPDQGIGHRRLTLIFNVVIALLSAALVISVARIRRRHRQLAQQGIASRSALWSRIAIAVVLNLALPIALVYLWLAVPAWRALILFEPDLGYWLAAVATVSFIKGVLELVFIARVNRRATAHRTRCRPGRRTARAAL